MSASRPHDAAPATPRPGPGPASHRSPVVEAWLAALLRPLVYGLCAGLWLHSFASEAVALLGAAGALVGALLGRILAGSRLRNSGVWLLAALGLALAFAARAWLTSSPLLAQAVGPAAAVEIANRVLAGVALLFCALSLRATALRYPVARVLEVAWIAFAFAEPFVAHRGGHINRPFEIADSIIAEGGDPAVVFRVVGAVAAGVAIAFLFSARSPWRTLLHVLVLAAVLPLLVMSTASMSLPDGADPLGLRGKDGKDSKGRQGKDGGKPAKGDKPRDKNDNDQLEFRDQYDQSGRRVPLAVVLLHDDYSPPSGMYYFRQSAFSQYNGKRLVLTSEAGLDRDTVPAFVSGPTDIAQVPSQDERTTLETTVALLADHARPFALESPISMRPVDNPDPGRFRRVYRVTSSALDVDYGAMLWRDVGDPSWTPSQRAHYLQQPVDPRYQELADTIVAGLPEELRDNPVARAIAVSLWLGKEGTYSLKSGHAGAEDPTADFLFGDRVGYCVHFAHASVYLMRALGIPARIGTGYVVEEAARQGGSAILLTGANSHAWPELYIEGAGWVIMDVAPERALDGPPPPPDPDLQRLLGEMARGLRPTPQSEQRLFQPVVVAAGRAWAAVRWVGLVGLPLCLLLLYLVKLWRRLAPALASPRRRARLVYRAELDRLAEVSLRRRYGESREAFAARLSHGEPGRGGSQAGAGYGLHAFEQLTRRHSADRYGGAQQAQGTRAELRALAASLRRERRGVAPWHRRLLGLLTPWSWLLSR